MAAGPGMSSNNPLLNPGAPLQGAALLQAAQGLANAQTQGPLAEIAKSIAQNNAQAQAAINLTGGYYNQLGSQARQGVTAQQGIASGLNTQLQGIGTQEQNALQGVGQNASSQLAKYTPGQGVGDSAQQALAAELARQSGLAAQNQAGFQRFGAQQGANFGGLAASNLGTFGLRGQEALKGIAQAGQLKNEPLVAKQAALKATYGADLASAIGKLRQQEITNQISQTGLGIRSATLQQTAANNQAHNQLTARGQDITLRGQNINLGLRQQQIDATLRGQNLSHQDRVAALAERSAVSNLRNGTGAAKALTSQENNTMLTQLGSVQSAIQTWQQGGIKDGKGNVLNAHPTPAQMRQVLGGKYNPVLVEAAFELLGYGSIDQSTAAAMHNMGIRGGTFRNAPIKVTANYNPNSPQQNPGSITGGLGRTITGAGNQIGNALGG